MHLDVTMHSVLNDPRAETYRKIGRVTAVQISTPFRVRTLEGVMVGGAGDYLVRGEGGEQWPVKRAIFENTYRAWRP